MQRFFVENNLDVEKIVLDDKDIVHQISRVMRSKIGDEIILVNDCLDVKCKILEIRKNNVLVEILDKHKNDKELDLKINLYCSVLKRENFELVVQKATELGVAEIHPLITERTVKQGLKMERLEKIAKEAAEQSGRGVIPDIFEPEKYSDVIDILNMKTTPQPPPAPPLKLYATRGSKGGEVLNYFFHCEETHHASSEAPFSRGELNTSTHIIKGSEVNLFIGPEGGWSEDEVALIRDKKNWRITSLGKTTLRGETAAIVACFWASYY